MKKILLVNPQSLQTQYSAIWELEFIKAKAGMAPLHLATIAALTPDDVEVDIWDEAVHGQIDFSTEFGFDYDLVGITGLSPHLERVKDIAQVFRKRGIPIAIGGVGVSATPERYRDVADILFLGEAELTWPKFIADWKAGDLKKEYRQITKPDLALSPIPRWDSLENQMKYYIQGAVQTTRGCPFDCEFCDVIYLFGRRTRSKPIDKVLEEVSVLERLGMERIFFCDDNFIGNRSYTKELLRELIPLNNSFRKPILFSTQLSIDLAQNEELLELMADANFGTLYIGIESPNKESLKETNKLQNVRSDLIEDCKKIMSYGMVIRAAMIVGFDNDDTSIFDQHFEFTQKSHIPLASTALLNAFTGTRLWRRLLAEGRLLSRSEAYKEGQTRLGRTNIIPKRMTRVELLSGYLDLLKRNHDWDNFAARVKEMASNVKRKPNVPQKSEPEEGLSSAAVNTFLFSLDEKARNAIISIFLHTRQHAPFMMEKVLGITLQQYSYAALMQSLEEDFQKQIELEKSGVSMEIDKTSIFIPESFRKPYEEIFPSVYERVYLGLTDKTRTEEALIEVFVDFITRWGGPLTLDKFSEQHKVYLFELADRTIEKENRTVGRKSPVPVQTEEAVEDIKKTRLAEEILKAVEKELRR